MNNQQIKDDLLKTEAASKIFNELNKLRKSSQEDQERFRKRWIWELIQNATDCCRDGETIDIGINFNGDSILTFSHNGRGFNKENLWSIVTQISSKIQDDDSTGKFGTGFISTTSISPNIIIDSFLENTKQKFLLNLDRSGEDVPSIRKSIDDNMRMIENLETTSSKTFSETNLTIFKYDLTNLSNKEKSVKSINDGIRSLEEHVFYLLGFNDKISSINCNGKKYVVKNKKSATKIPNCALVDIIEENSQTKISLIIADFKNGSVAAPMHIENGKLKFYKIDSSISKLFCNFPLIGTENYPFPIILNSGNFSVEIDRDGIFESDVRNIKIIENAIRTYENLLNYFSDVSKIDIFNICEFEKSQKTEYKKKVAQEVESIIFRKKLVSTHNDKLLSILDSHGDKQIFVPREKEERFEAKFWGLLSQIPSINIPKLEDCDGWKDIIDNNITVSDINNDYLKGKTIDGFKEWFGKNEIISWLNDYYHYVEDVGNKRINLFFPNIEGVFLDLNKIKLVDQVIPELLDIFFLINPKVKNEIVYDGLKIPDSLKSYMFYYTNEEIASLVADHIHALLSKEKKENRSQETEKIFNQMLELFSMKKYSWDKLFPSIYFDRAKLRSQKFNEDLNQLGDALSEKNLTVESITSIISNDCLLNTLLTSPEELPEEIIQQLQHINKSSFYGKKKVDELIQRSKLNIYNQLSKNPKYKVSNTFEDWEAEKMSTTVFKAIKDDTEELLIVVRPSDEGKIIFYEEQELSALDSNNYELWVDNGEKVCQLTLGDILKTTNITVIPLRNLFLEEVDER